MNMTVSKKHTANDRKFYRKIAAFILNLLFIILAYGRPLEIKGAVSPLLWLFALGLIICSVIIVKKYAKLLFIMQLIIYIAASGLFYIREYDGAALYSADCRDNILTEVYEVNPGAMGHYSVQRREYFCIINNDILSVKILLSRETKRGSLTL